MKEDLRIGNLVTDEFFDSFSKVIVVESINDKGINLEVQNSDDYPELQRHWIEPYYTFEELRGIPLTEEWLLKMGFEKDGEGDWQKGDFAFTLGSEGLKLFMEYGFINPPIKFVHQLQNLYFALTGEELKITASQSKQQ